MEPEYDYLFKIIIIGDSSVGKSSVLARFVEDRFSAQYISTIGVDFRIKTVQVDNKIIKLQMWDTAGQERFRTITSSYYRGCHGVICVADLTDKESFKSIDKWINEVNQYSSYPDIPKILFGNKVDLTNKIVVHTKYAEERAREYGMMYYETSAKNGQGVEEGFNYFTEKVMEHYKTFAKHVEATSNIKVVKGKVIKSRENCC